MSKYHRKQRKGPEDEFVGFWEEAFNRIAPFARAIGIVCATAFGIVLVTWIASSWFERRAEGAAELFGRALKIYDAELITDANETPKTDEDAIPRFKSMKERAEATLLALDQLDKKYGSSDVAKDAWLFRAGVEYDLGRIDEARSHYQKAADRAPKDPALLVVAREGVGLCDEAKGKFDDAIRAYAALAPKTGEFYKDRALWDQARVYVKKGEKSKAIELYKEVLTKMPGSQLRDDIQTKILMLEGT